MNQQLCPLISENVLNGMLFPIPRTLTIKIVAGRQISMFTLKKLTETWWWEAGLLTETVFTHS